MRISIKLHRLVRRAVGKVHYAHASCWGEKSISCLNSMNAKIPYAYVLGNHDWMARPFPPKARDVIRYDIKYGNTSLTREGR